MQNNTEKFSNYSKIRGVIEIPYKAAPQPTEVVSSKEERATEKMLAVKRSQYTAWEEFIISSGPYTYAWTLSFMNPYSDNASNEALWKCTSFINRELWGPRWDKNKLGLRCTVVAERHKASLELRGRLHFHMLVHEQSGNMDAKRFTEAANTSCLRLKDSYGRNMTSPDRINIQEIYGIDGIANYLTKDLKTAHWSRGDNIFFIREGGLEGNVMPKMSSKELSKLH